MPVMVFRWMPLKKRVLAVAAVFGRLLFRMRLAGRGAPSTTMIWPSLEPVATSLLPSWSMIETQQTPGLEAAALTAGLRSTWTLAAIPHLWLPRGPQSRRQACRLPRPASFPTSFPRCSRALRLWPVVTYHSPHVQIRLPAAVPRGRCGRPVSPGRLNSALGLGRIRRPVAGRTQTGKGCPVASNC